MVLDVSRALQQLGESFPFCIEQETLTDRQAQRLPTGVSIGGVRVDGFFIGARDIVFVRGSANARIVCECARCLQPVELTISAGVHEVYGHTPDPNEPERYAFHGHMLDIEEQVYSTLLLALPIRTLCREDCAGLCQTCGANLNEGACTCHGSD